jgi:hypothetical protein
MRFLRPTDADTGRPDDTGDDDCERHARHDDSGFSGTARRMDSLTPVACRPKTAASKEP